uniref:Phosphodiesterase n=1 Tax=Macrostomum lignano TaxID=282301 RepID=A0A1I8JFR9_9PLAT
ALRDNSPAQYPRVQRSKDPQLISTEKSGCTIDRWIQQHLHMGDLADLRWVDESEGVFRIDWPHMSAAHWDLARRENNVFLAYARHRDYTVLKQKLRCALTGNKSIDYLPARSSTRGSSACRVYRLRAPVHSSAPDLSTAPSFSARGDSSGRDDVALSTSALDQASATGNPDDPQLDSNCPESLLSGPEYNDIVSSCKDWLEPLQQTEPMYRPMTLVTRNSCGAGADGKDYDCIGSTMTFSRHTIENVFRSLDSVILCRICISNFVTFESKFSVMMIMNFFNLEIPEEQSLNSHADMPKDPIDAWLLDRLHSGDFADLRWFNQQEGQFRVDWPHGKLKAFNSEEAARQSIFAAWARYRGACASGHKRSYSVLKQTFRCALNGNRRVEFCPAESGAAFRVFRFVGNSRFDSGTGLTMEFEDFLRGLVARKTDTRESAGSSAFILTSGSAFILTASSAFILTASSAFILTAVPPSSSPPVPPSSSPFRLHPPVPPHRHALTVAAPTMPSEKNVTFNDASQAAIWTAFSALMIVSIVGNGVVVWIILAHAQMRSVTNIFLLNLSLSDILLCALQVVPNVCYAIVSSWKFGLFYCRLSNFITTFSISLSVFTFMAIAIERYMVIVYPLRPRPRRGTIISSLVFIWAFSTLTAAPVAWNSNIVDELTGSVSCKMEENMTRTYNWILLTLQCLVPLIVVGFTYIVIAIRLWKQQPIGEQVSTHQAENIRAKRKVLSIKQKAIEFLASQIVKMMIIVVLIFALCWIPYQLMFFTVKEAWQFIILYFIAVCSTVPNPFIYCKMNHNFRLGFKRAFAWCPCVTIEMEKYKLLRQRRHTNFAYSLTKSESRAPHHQSLFLAQRQHQPQHQLQQSLFARERSRRMQRSKNLGTNCPNEALANSTASLSVMVTVEAPAAAGAASGSRDRSQPVNMTDPPEAGEAVHPSSAIDETAVESWLESHPEFFEDYFYRKATRRLVDTWVYRRVRTATTTSSHGASFSSFDWHSIPETLAQQQNQQQQPAGGDSAIQEEIESSVNVSRSTSCSSNVIRKILRNVCLLIGADRCSLFLVESAPGRSQLELVSNLFDVTADSCLETILANHSSIRIPIGQGIVGSVALTGEPVRIADAYQDERFNAEIDKQTGYRTKSVLCLPVKDHTGAVIGVTQAVNKRDGGVFSETDEKTFETFLTFCGIGIRNAKLYKQSQLETKRNQVLLDMVRIISEQQDNLDPLVRKIMHYMQLITTCRWCQILLIDDPTSVEGMFDHAFELRFEDDDANSATVHDGESRQPAAPVVTDYCRMLLKQRTHKSCMRHWEELERLSISALLCLPIKNAQSRVAGLCLLMNKSDGGAFTSGDQQQLAEAFALFCGLGIHNTRMFERAEVAKRRQQVALEVLSYHAVASSEDAQKLAKCLIPSSRFLGINEFSFSDLAMSDEETLISVIKMFEDTGLFSAFKLNYASFCRWILSVKENYRAVTYHNWRHALNVTQCMFAMLRTSPELRGLNRLDKLALLVASICHDLDHRGTDNKFQRLTLSPLAQLY